MVAFQDVTRPSTTQDALHAPGLRFGDPRVMATLAATCRFAHVFADFANRDLREAVAFLLGCDTPPARRPTTCAGSDEGSWSPASPDLPLPAQPLGREIAVFFTKAYSRILTPVSPSEIRRFPQRWQNAAPSLPPGVPSTTRWTTILQRTSPQHETRPKT